MSTYVCISLSLSLCVALNRLEAPLLPRSGREAGRGGGRGLRAQLRFMLNSESISRALPSLQPKQRGEETQAHRNPLALTGAVFNHLSRGPGATEHCQQTFH